MRVKQVRKLLHKDNLLKRRSLLIFVLVFSILGPVLVLKSKAATTSSSIEAEAGSLSGGATVVQDNTASGSASVMFGDGSPAPSSTVTAGVAATVAANAMFTFQNSNTTTCTGPVSVYLFDTQSSAWATSDSKYLPAATGTWAVQLHAPSVTGSHYLIRQNCNNTLASDTPLTVVPDTSTPPPPPPAGSWQLGMRPFTSTSSWNTPVPNSATYVNIGLPAATNSNYWVDWDNYSSPVYVGTSSDPLIAVTHPANWGYPAETVQMRIPAGAIAAAGDDGTLIIINGTTVYNMWRFTWTGATTAYAEAYGKADAITSSGWGQASPSLSAGITAIGHSYFAGLLVEKETSAGEIAHALELSVETTLNAPGWTGEAIWGDGPTPGGILQEGARLAIPKSVTMPSGLSPLGQKVFRALQTYGAYDVDSSGGSTVLRAQTNAYDSSTIDALRTDWKILAPMLRLVQ